MTAKELYEKQVAISKCGNYVTMHQKSDPNFYYMISPSLSFHSITKLPISNDSLGTEISSFDELAGDDFELFSTYQIIKTGYLILVGEDNDANDVMNKIFDYLELLTEREEHKNIIMGNSSVTDGYVDYFWFSDSENNIEMTLETIPSFRSMNIFRKKKTGRCIPFRKFKDDSNIIHVHFVSEVRMNEKEALKNAEKTNEIFLGILKEMGIKVIWKNVKIKYPIYYN